MSYSIPNHGVAIRSVSSAPVVDINEIEEN